MCGSGRNIDIGHIDGHEEDNSPANTFFTCRRCNVLSGNTLRAAGLGRLTHQRNAGDVPKPDEWLIQRARAAAGGGRIHGAEQLVASYRVFGEILRRRPDDRESRRKFYEIENKLRAGQFNPADGARSLGQWMTAIMAMRGESDLMPVAGAVAMIRATSPQQRSRFAQEIWDKRREHYGSTGRSAVPF